MTRLQRPSHPSHFGAGQVQNGRPSSLLASASPIRVTPSQGNTGTISAVDGGIGKKPIQASQRSRMIGKLTSSGSTMIATPTAPVSSAGSRRKASAISENSASACSTPKNAKYSPKAIHVPMLTAMAAATSIASRRRNFRHRIPRPCASQRLTPASSRKLETMVF